MKTQLIKLKDYNIIVSDEEIKDDELYISWETNYKTEPKERFVLYYKSSGLNGYNPKKIIASDNPKHNLPSIDYNRLEEEFGWIDVEKLDEDIWFDRTHGKEVCVHKGDWKLGFKEGFKKAQSLNDKKFSLENIRHLDFLFNRLKNVHDENENYDYMIKFKEIIQSLQQPKVFDIEVEMEEIRQYEKNPEFFGTGQENAKMSSVYRPKITNNQIKILSIK